MTHKTKDSARPRTTWIERAVVLGGFALAALCTPLSVATGVGIENLAAAWLAASVWAALSSLVLALRRGIRHRDWRAFGRYGMTDGTELVDWSTKSGACSTWPSPRKTSG